MSNSRLRLATEFLSVYRTRMSRALLYRLGFLLAGNLILLAAIFFYLKEGASFSQVLLRAGPDTAPTILSGLGMTGIIFAGSIDLSVGAIIVVSGTVFGILAHRGISPAVAYAACFLTAWCLSMLNGYLVRLLRIPAIILTLAGLTFYRGLALIIPDVGIPNFSGYIAVQSDAYHGPGKFYAGWILLSVLLGALAWEAIAETPRRWLALGNSEEACRLQGLRPGSILQSAFFAGGLFLGLASLIEVTRVQAIEPARMAAGFELPVIGAVVLGGTNIFGGEGSYSGTVLGAFFLYLAEQLLIYAEVSAYSQKVILGATIIAVIGLDCFLQRRRKHLEELR